MSKIVSINLIDTAKLIRQSLKESFPGVKFSVRSERYANGSSIHACWTDGPGREMVESITCRYRGGYCEPHTDYRSNLYHRLDGALVSFAPDHVFCHRKFSDKAVASAIHAVYEEHREILRDLSIEKPTTADFFAGKLQALHLWPTPPEVPMHQMFDELTEPRTQTMLDAVLELLNASNDRVAPADSRTANRVTILVADNDKGAIPEKHLH